MKLQWKQILKPPRWVVATGALVALTAAFFGPAITREAEYYPVGLVIMTLPRELHELTFASALIICAPYAIYALLIAAIEYALWICCASVWRFVRTGGQPTDRRS